MKDHVQSEKTIPSISKIFYTLKGIPVKTPEYTYQVNMQNNAR